MESAQVWLKQRERVLNELDGGTVDVLVAGGGIVGSGVVRDAVMRGLRVALVDKGDFASGTSSRSARLLHGGLRYLAQGNVRLVREASLEKLVIRRIAPHLASPLPFMFPTYRGTPWSRWKLAVGVKLYDLLCNGHNFGNSRMLSTAEIAQRLPGLKQQGLTGGVRYFDGLTNDARLVLDTLRSARRHGALLANHVKLTEPTLVNGLWQCRLQDVLGGREALVKARVVVNATGPWSGTFPQSQVAIRGTKGVHVVFDRARLPLEEALMMTEGTRVIWAIPWGKRLYLGCTDTDYTGALEDVQTEPQDIEYLIGVLNRAFPDARFTTADILNTWAGVRPLVLDPKGKPSEVSRSHEIRTTGTGWFDVAGGKLTTYRRMASQVMDRVARHLGRKLAPCRTDQEPLLDAADAAVGSSGIEPPAPTETLVRHYCCNEWAVNLADIMVRRTRWHYYEQNPSETAQKVAGWMAPLLGWSEEEKQRQLDAYRHYRN